MKQLELKGHKVQLVSESDKAEKESKGKANQKRDNNADDSGGDSDDAFPNVEDVDEEDFVDDSDPFTHRKPTKKVKDINNSAEKQKPSAQTDSASKDESEKVTAQLKQTE